MNILFHQSSIPTSPPKQQKGTLAIIKGLWTTCFNSLTKYRIGFNSKNRKQQNSSSSQFQSQSEWSHIPFPYSNSQPQPYPHPQQPESTIAQNTPKQQIPTAIENYNNGFNTYMPNIEQLDKYFLLELESFRENIKNRENRQVSKRMLCYTDFGLMPGYLLKSKGNGMGNNQKKIDLKQYLQRKQRRQFIRNRYYTILQKQQRQKLSHKQHTRITRQEITKMEAKRNIYSESSYAFPKKKQGRIYSYKLTKSKYIFDTLEPILQQNKQTAQIAYRQIQNEQCKQPATQKKYRQAKQKTNSNKQQQNQSKTQKKQQKLKTIPTIHKQTKNTHQIKTVQLFETYTSQKQLQQHFSQQIPYASQFSKLSSLKFKDEKSELPVYAYKCRTSKSKNKNVGKNGDIKIGQQQKVEIEECEVLKQIIERKGPSKQCIQQAKRIINQKVNNFQIKQKKDQKFIDKNEQNENNPRSSTPFQNNKIKHPLNNKNINENCDQDPQNIKQTPNSDNISNLFKTDNVQNINNPNTNSSNSNMPINPFLSAPTKRLNLDDVISGKFDPISFHNNNNNTKSNNSSNNNNNNNNNFTNNQQIFSNNDNMLKISEPGLTVYNSNFNDNYNSNFLSGNMGSQIKTNTGVFDMNNSTFSAIFPHINININAPASPISTPITNPNKNPSPRPQSSHPLQFNLKFQQPPSLPSFTQTYQSQSPSQSLSKYPFTLPSSNITHEQFTKSAIAMFGNSGNGNGNSGQNSSLFGPIGGTSGNQDKQRRRRITKKGKQPARI